MPVRPRFRWRLALPDTLFVRVALLLLVNLLLIQIVTYCVFRFEIDRPVLSDRDLPERLATSILVLAAAPPDARPVLIAALVTPQMQIALTPERDPHPFAKHPPEHLTEHPAEREASPLPRGGGGELKDRVSLRLPPEWGGRLTQYGPDENNGGESAPVILNARLQDGTVVGFQIDYIFTARHHLRALIAIVMALVTISIVSLFFVRRLSQKLDDFARAAEALGRSVQAPPLPETGPSELRRATRAFNVMQERLSRFITDRTQMLAAISHDLRTPLTRMRLRAEFVEDEGQRDKMLGDLADMQSMISATLAFARDDATREPRAPFDLALLLRDLAETGEELGHAIHCHADGPAMVTGSPLAIRRAVGNLIDNACKYGHGAVITLDGPRDGHYRIVIADTGPGIPTALLEQVFQPFFRLESSRNRDTGGVGLGLSVARTILRSHGGDVTLTNDAKAGLCARIILPA